MKDLAYFASGGLHRLMAESLGVPLETVKAAYIT